jgi:hypothetical protein
MRAGTMRIVFHPKTVSEAMAAKPAHSSDCYDDVRIVAVKYYESGRVPGQGAEHITVIDRRTADASITAWPPINEDCEPDRVVSREAEALGLITPRLSQQQQQQSTSSVSWAAGAKEAAAFLIVQLNNVDNSARVWASVFGRPMPEAVARSQRRCEMKRQSFVGYSEAMLRRFFRDFRLNITAEAASSIPTLSSLWDMAKSLGVPLRRLMAFAFLADMRTRGDSHAIASRAYWKMLLGAEPAVVPDTAASFSAFLSRASPVEIGNAWIAMLSTASWRGELICPDRCIPMPNDSVVPMALKESQLTEANEIVRQEADRIRAEARAREQERDRAAAHERRKQQKAEDSAAALVAKHQSEQDAAKRAEEEAAAAAAAASAKRAAAKSAQQRPATPPPPPAPVLVVRRPLSAVPMADAKADGAALIACLASIPKPKQSKQRAPVDGFDAHFAGFVPPRTPVMSQTYLAHVFCIVVLGDAAHREAYAGEFGASRERVGAHAVGIIDDLFKSGVATKACEFIDPYTGRSWVDHVSRIFDDKCIPPPAGVAAPGYADVYDFITQGQKIINGIIERDQYAVHLDTPSEIVPELLCIFDPAWPRLWNARASLFSSSSSSSSAAHQQSQRENAWRSRKETVDRISAWRSTFTTAASGEWTGIVMPPQLRALAIALCR